MSKLNSSENHYNFWKELICHNKAVKTLGWDIHVSLCLSGEEYTNISKSAIAYNDEEIWVDLTKNLKVTVFRFNDFKDYFENHFEDSGYNVFGLAHRNFCSSFKFYKSVKFEDL